MRNKLKVIIKVILPLLILILIFLDVKYSKITPEYSKELQFSEVKEDEIVVQYSVDPYAFSKTAKGDFTKYKDSKLLHETLKNKYITKNDMEYIKSTFDGDKHTFYVKALYKYIKGSNLLPINIGDSDEIEGAGYHTSYEEVIKLHNKSKIFIDEIPVKVELIVRDNRIKIPVVSNVIHFFTTLLTTVLGIFLIIILLIIFLFSDWVM